MREQYNVFASMPFGENPESDQNEWTRLYNHGIKCCEQLALEDRLFASSNMTQGQRTLTIARADFNLKALGLKENVRFHIDVCDFMICVLTIQKGSDALLNPNLLWEIGYAEARRKPIVFLGNDECVRRIPALVGSDNLFCLFEPQLFEPDSKLGRLEDHGARVAKDLMPFIRAAIDRIEERQPGRRGCYEVLAYSDRRHVNLVQFLKSARSTIDILTTNLDYFRKEKDRLKETIERGVTIRIAVMDPDCHIAEYRAKQLGLTGDVGQYREELRNAILELYVHFEKYYGDRFKIMVYEDLPLQITIRVDNEVITSFVTRGKRSRERLHVRFRVEDEGVFDTFVGHFGGVFDGAKDIRQFSWLYREKKNRRPNDSAMASENEIRGDAEG